MFQAIPKELCEAAEADARFVGLYFESIAASNLASSVRWCFDRALFDHSSIEDELVYISWMADIRSVTYKIRKSPDQSP